jgi:hypothetical protein
MKEILLRVTTEDVWKLPDNLFEQAVEQIEYAEYLRITKD